LCFVLLCCVVFCFVVFCCIVLCCVVLYMTISYIFSSFSKFGRNSLVGIVTRYGLEGPGIESRWNKIFHTRPDGPWDPPSLLYNEYQVSPGGKAAGVCRSPTPTYSQG
jgi:hypothetical protein